MSFQADPYITLELAGVDVDSGSWFCVNKHELVYAYAPQVGQNIDLAETDGRLGRPHYDDEQTVDLRWVITGNHIGEGDVFPSPEARLAAVKRLFAATYFRATRDDNGCVDCDVVDIDGSEFGGPVQLGPPVFSDGLYECGAVMSVTIPRGELEPVGS